MVGDDARVRGDFRVLVGVPGRRRLAGQHEAGLQPVGDYTGLGIGHRELAAVLVAGCRNPSPNQMRWSVPETMRSPGHGNWVGEEAVLNSPRLGHIGNVPDDQVPCLLDDVVPVVEQAGQVGVTSERCGRHRRPFRSSLPRCGRASGCRTRARQGPRLYRTVKSWPLAGWPG